MIHPFFKEPVIVIQPGEYYASEKGEIISTVLGSCVAVALFDETAKIGGMNHFMLPEEKSNYQEFYKTRSGRYGMYAMELLINALLKLGANKFKLKAKAFGGANVLSQMPPPGKPKQKSLMVNEAGFSVAEKNVHFALNYLKIEEIPLLNSDVGGGVGRKLFFFTDTNKVLVKKLSQQIVMLSRESDKFKAFTPF
jgi:chemotaxis protein CheD